MMSGEYCEGVFPDTVCWTRLGNTWIRRNYWARAQGYCKRGSGGQRKVEKIRALNYSKNLLITLICSKFKGERTWALAISTLLREPKFRTEFPYFSRDKRPEIGRKKDLYEPLLTPLKISKSYFALIYSKLCPYSGTPTNSSEINSEE